MSGLMRRFSRGRATADDEASPPATGASEAVGDAAADPHAGGAPLPEDATTVDAGAETTRAGSNGAAGVDETAVTGEGTPAEPATAAEPAPGRDLPAGVDLDELAAAPIESAARSHVRRRLRYLRHVRELLLRDLGGFYAEAHRSEPGPDAHRRLLDVKARRLATLDAELRDLEARLSEPHAETILREPGIGGACPECGELFGSEARFCSRCGTPLRGRAARERAKARAAAAAGTTGTGTSGATTGAGTSGEDDGDRMTTASLWGRPRTPPPADPADATRAGDLTQAAQPDERAAQPAADADEPAAAPEPEPERPEPEHPEPEPEPREEPRP
jgi:hypothetical protein